jgi:hypothetical protein
MEGYTKEEIAGRHGCVTRSVERKLRLIRGLWGQEEARPDLWRLDGPTSPRNRFLLSGPKPFCTFR